MKAIVIGSIPYSDSSRVVRVLTRDEGVIPVFVRISKKSGGALWHPLALLELNDLSWNDITDRTSRQWAEWCQDRDKVPSKAN